MNLFHRLHRTLGQVLSVLFVLWFLSGFVMIYHNFPRITESERYHGLATCDTSAMATADSLLRLLPAGRLSALALTTDGRGGVRLTYTSDGQTHTIGAQTTADGRVAYDEILHYATRLNPSPIVRVDTVRHLDRWLTYDRNLDDLPAYRFHYADATELYVSSRTGEGLQHSTRADRFWAWVGAIPHWIYLFNLRHYTGLWRNVVIILSGVGALMCLFGLIVGVRMIVRQYRQRRRLGSPYRKPLYRWHHVAGLFFGLFVFTFAFSGMMSLQKVPQWLIRTHAPELASAASDRSLPLAPADYPLDYRKLLEAHNGRVQKIEWCGFGRRPYYRVVVGDSALCIDAATPDVRPLSLTESEVEGFVRDLLPDSRAQATLLRNYDDYYIHKRMQLPLPVYRLTVDDPDRSSFYVNPATAEVRYFNANTRARKWTYQALHSFSVKWILDRPVLWHVLMFGSMVGGTIVSLTGLWFLVRRLRRPRKR